MDNLLVIIFSLFCLIVGIYIGAMCIGKSDYWYMWYK